ncbi:hypothetical protein [Nonomuraea sp. B19D2]
MKNFSRESALPLRVVGQRAAALGAVAAIFVIAADAPHRVHAARRVVAED